MRNIAIILFTILLFTNCGSSRKDATEKENEQIKEKNTISTFDNREIHHLLVISYPKHGAVKTELQAFFTDGSVINYTGDITEASIQDINQIATDGTYYKEMDGKLFCYSKNGDLFVMRDLSKRSEIIQNQEANNPWVKNRWAMINGKWLIRPIDMKMDKQFKEIPGSETLELISVLLDGYCSSEKIEMDTDGWYQLSYLSEQKEFEIAPVNLSVVEFYWDCGDMNMYTITSDRANSILLFEGLNINLGIVNSHFHEITCVMPDTNYTFSFNNIDYTLRAEGILDPYSDEKEGEYDLTTDGRKETGNVYQEYKLYLESGGISQLILAIDNFSNRYVRINFIGDLDKDGKPDFIFDTTTWYEDYEKTLFLSSFADKGELVKYVGRNGYSMAC